MKKTGNADKIVIDARMIPYTGIGRYIWSISKRLPRLDTRREYLFIVPSQRYGQALDQGENTAYVVNPTPRYTVREHFSIASTLLEHKPVLFHAMNYIMPPKSPCASIVTIHDAIRPMMPQCFYTNEEFIHRFGMRRFLEMCTVGLLLLALYPLDCRRLGRYMSPDYRCWLNDQGDAEVRFKMHHLYQILMMRRVIGEAERIITVSNHSKGDIRQLFHDSEPKTTVIYPGVDERFRPVTDSSKLASARKRYQLPCEFIMYVGLRRPHKNVHGLLRAFADLLNKNEFEDVYLVLVGEESRFDSHVPQLIQDMSLADRVVFTGYVPDEDLVILYNLARSVVVPSFYEGFGLPVVEAMASGTPVIASSSTALPEVAGDAAILVNPDSRSELSLAIISILKNAQLREHLRTAGLKRSKRFSWDQAARQTLKVYDEVLRDRQ